MQANIIKVNNLKLTELHIIVENYEITIFEMNDFSNNTYHIVEYEIVKHSNKAMKDIVTYYETSSTMQRKEISESDYIVVQQTMITAIKEKINNRY